MLGENPCHPLQDVRRDQAGKEQGHNYAADNSVPLTKVFAHGFHGARFYSLWIAAQFSRLNIALRRLVYLTRRWETGTARSCWTCLSTLAGSRGAFRPSGARRHRQLQGGEIEDARIYRHASL